MLRLATLAQDSGLDGVVLAVRGGTTAYRSCGAFPAGDARRQTAGAATDDQKRIMTPGDAIRAGASYLVVGRPVTRALTRSPALPRSTPRWRKRSPESHGSAAGYRPWWGFEPGYFFANA